MFQEKNDLQFSEGWARQEHLERSQPDRRVLTQVLGVAKCPTTPRPLLPHGENHHGRKGTAIATQLLPGGTIQSRGMTMVPINGPTTIIHAGPGTTGSTDGAPNGAGNLVPARLIGAKYLGGSRHPVPAQEGPRGAWCLVLMTNS